MVLVEGRVYLPPEVLVNISPKLTSSESFISSDE